MQERLLRKAIYKKSLIDKPFLGHPHSPHVPVFSTHQVPPPSLMGSHFLLTCTFLISRSKVKARPPVPLGIKVSWEPSPPWQKQRGGRNCTAVCLLAFRGKSASPPSGLVSMILSKSTSLQGKKVRSAGGGGVTPQTTLYANIAT